jgi:hypothetical protein
MATSRVPISSLPNGSILIAGTYNPAIGATAYVYKHGTTTQVTVYAAETGASTLTQPLTSDSNGQLPGYVLAEEDLDIVATYLGHTAGPAEVVALRAQDLAGIDPGTGQPAVGAGVVPLLSSVVSSSQESGLKKLPAGLRSVVNITDPKYGGKAEGAGFDNRTAILAAITDAKTLRLPVYAPAAASAYGFSGLIAFDNVDLIGDGGGLLSTSTELLCLTAGSRIAFGHTEAGGNTPVEAGSPSSRAHRTGGFVINGNNVATQPCSIGRRVQSLFDPISIIKGAAQPAYNAGTTYHPGEKVLYKGFTFKNLVESTGTAPSVTEWVANKGAGAYPLTTATWELVADSAGLVIQEAQNNLIQQLNIQECAGADIIFDGGCGGNTIKVLEANASGSAGAYQVMYLQTYAHAEGIYEVPSENIVEQAIIERGSAGCLGPVLHVAGTQNEIRGHIQSPLTTAYSAVAMVYDGTHGSHRFKFYGSIGLAGEESNAFAVANSTSLEHRTTVFGGSVKYAYLLQTGARVDDKGSPWTEASGLTLLNPSGTVTTTAASRSSIFTSFSGTIRGYVVNSGLESPGWSMTEAGVLSALGVQFGGGLSAGASGYLSGGVSGVIPTENPAEGVVCWWKNGAMFARNKNGDIYVLAGRRLNKSAAYQAIAGDVTIFFTSANGHEDTITLQQVVANEVGKGTRLTLRRIDGSTGVLKLAPHEGQKIAASGSAPVSTFLTVATYTPVTVEYDGTETWWQV